MVLHECHEDYMWFSICYSSQLHNHLTEATPHQEVHYTYIAETTYYEILAL
jgi:hypothetical protein